MTRKLSIFRFLYMYGKVTIFDLELQRKGFSKIFQDHIRKSNINFSLGRELDKKVSMEISIFFQMLDIVCAWYPRKADCIHKTFIGYKLLRRKYKIPVDMVVGVRKFPFEAHAWLKLGDVNFFKDEVDTDKYKIVLRSNHKMGGERP
ncbi:hypothetical protein D3C74_202600 [compost metagenome]